MKKFTDRMVNALFAFALLLLFALGGSAIWPNAYAQIINRYATPAQFTDYTGTNFFGVDANAKPIVRSGGTIYTGITTNMQMYGGATNSMRLVIINGLVVGVTTY